MTMDTIYKKAYDTLRANHIYDDIELDGLIIKVHIEWGDWKHEHLACVWALEELGLEEKFERVTEEDGSDTYSSIHYFVPNQELMESMLGD